MSVPPSPVLAALSPLLFDTICKSIHLFIIPGLRNLGAAGLLCPREWSGTSPKELRLLLSPYLAHNASELCHFDASGIPLWQTCISLSFCRPPPGGLQPSPIWPSSRSTLPPPRVPANQPPFGGFSPKIVQKWPKMVFWGCYGSFGGGVRCSIFWKLCYEGLFFCIFFFRQLGSSPPPEGNGRVG